MGTLIPKPRNIPPNIQSCAVRETALATTLSAISLKTNDSAPVKKKRERKLTSISADPKRVYKKNFKEAYFLFGPPQTAIIKNIGSKTTSKKTKKRTMSCATKVPIMPVSKTRISIKNVFGFLGSGKWFQL